MDHGNFSCCKIGALKIIGGLHWLVTAVLLDQIQKIKCKINLRKLAKFQISFFHIFKELVIIAVIGITHGRINGLWKDPPLTKSGAEWLNTCICQFLTNGAKLV